MQKWVNFLKVTISLLIIGSMVFFVLTSCKAVWSEQSTYQKIQEVSNVLDSVHQTKLSKALTELQYTQKELNDIKAAHELAVQYRNEAEARITCLMDSINNIVQSASKLMQELAELKSNKAQSKGVRKLQTLSEGDDEGDDGEERVRRLPRTGMNAYLYSGYTNTNSKNYVTDENVTNEAGAQPATDYYSVSHSIGGSRR